ncbi:formimidoylglutamate deiminase [Azospirillum picis]|uniref:Formimidoylglutamate deiminase n=1 Tax=Azospirillum picis TaxID=488438 RepID=A0ABU0MHZ4_9PROT|nr:formimidoylglutamate deiminase [Azospirillum picis]MBP2299282.1 formimidoylglutamate deiminase [Azospirillum picis]MDQ0533080.1 formimidoylglutamate deiminase [Azospirillum picis]
MSNLFFASALLPDGWAENVLVTTNARGRIGAVTAGAACPADADRFAGTAVAGIGNLHSHAHQRAIAGMGEVSGDGSDSFWSWREVMYRALDRMTPDDFQAVAAQLYVETLKAGYTAIAEFHYLHHDRDGSAFSDPAEMSHRVVAAAREAGLPVTLLPVLYNASGFGGTPPTSGQRRFINDGARFLRLTGALRAAYGGDDDVRLGIAPHSLRAVPDALLGETVAAHPDGPIHIHVAEQRKEVEDCLAHHGRRPVEHLLATQPVDGRWCLIHATHMTDTEVRGVAASGAVAGLCLTTEANLGDGFYAAERYLGLGGRWGVGSDSHISVSPVEELRWLEYGVRLTSGRRTVLSGGPRRSTGRRLVEDAQAGGAQATSFETGRIAPGRRADIVVLDTGHPLLAARTGDALLDGWIFSGNVPLVSDVVVAGRTVVRDRRHPREEEIAGRFKKTLGRLLG